MNCYCLITDDNFNVISCNDAAGRPELKFTVDRDFFNQNLNWQTDQVGFLKFITDYSVEQPSKQNQRKFIETADHYEKTVPENELQNRLNDDCK